MVVLGIVFWPLGGISAQSLEETLPDYFSYREAERACARSDSLCLKMAGQFLETFQTPYLREKVRALRFRALCNLSGKPRFQGEILADAPLAETQDIIDCAEKLQNCLPALALQLYKEALLRADEGFLRAKQGEP